MSQDHELSKRPDRVIIVDAEDPMREIRGTFVWLEEHERVITEARREAFADGYSAGRRDAAPADVRLQVTRGRQLGGWLRLAVLVLLTLFVLLMLPIVLT